MRSVWKTPTPRHRELPAGHPHTALGKIFRGNGAHKTTTSTSSVKDQLSLVPPSADLPLPLCQSRGWGCDSTSAACSLHPGRPLSPSLNLSTLPNPASPGKQGTDGSQQPGGNVQGEKGGRKNTSKSSTYFIGVKCLSDVLKGP